MGADDHGGRRSPSANSILLVTFARERQLAGRDGVPSRTRGGRHPCPPGDDDVAGAMIVGMIPMAIGGPGEEQNAALARAVIGGLLFATPTTLLIVPYLPCLAAQAQRRRRRSWRISRISPMNNFGTPDRNARDQPGS